MNCTKVFYAFPISTANLHSSPTKQQSAKRQREKIRDTYRTLSSSRLPCTKYVLYFTSSPTRLFDLACLPTTSGEASTDRWEVSDGVRPVRTGDEGSGSAETVLDAFMPIPAINGPISLADRRSKFGERQVAPPTYNVVANNSTLKLIQQPTKMLLLGFECKLCAYRSRPFRANPINK